MKTPKLEAHEVAPEELQSVLTAVEGKIAPHHFELLSRMVATLLWLFQLLEQEGATLKILRRLFLGRERTTEKTDKVLGPSETDPASPEACDGSEDETHGNQSEGQESGAPVSPEEEAAEVPKKRKGHGRNGVAQYPGAERVPIPHPSLKHGDSCPACDRGSVYQQLSGNILRIRGRAVLEAKVYQPERLRCGLCGELFQPELPPEVGEETYDETAKSMVALLKYGSGMPFYRLEQLQEGFQVPLPDAVQWDLVKEAYDRIQPAHEFLATLAGQEGEIFYNDDTGMTILDVPPDPERPPGRTGTFTTGLVVQVRGHLVALFFTGWKHAGENLDALLEKRPAGAPLPLQMSDALSRNVPKQAPTREANCNSHGRRNFVKIVDHFPEQCRRVLTDLRDVYRNDAETKARQMSAEERLHYHQEHSKPVLEALQKWMQQQLDEHLVEPNGGLGKAMNYMLKRWDKLTLFLRVPGAPLDNNICERALKLAVLHRKNALFYKTETGAAVGDLYMSLIHTCRLNGVNPFDYLTELQRHEAEVKAAPQDWMPWNYRATLAARNGSALR